MADSIFFTTLDNTVTKALEARKAYHGATERGESAHNWLFRKYAVVTATATNEKTNKTKSLSIPTKGGLGRTNQSGKSFGGLYQGTQPAKSKASFDGGRYFPKPHITNVKIASTGTYGSTRQCDLSFTVYTLADLNSYGVFFELGAKLEVFYSWSVPSEANGPSGKFTGNVYNFSYQLNADGGFDCTVNAMEKGINILPANVQATPKSDKKTVDPLGTTINVNNIIDEIDYTIKEKLENLQAPGYDPNTGFGVTKFPESWPTKEDEDEDDETPGKTSPPSPYYISLESIINTINLILSFSSEKFEKIAIECKEVKAVKPYFQFASSNPIQCLFPGYTAYSVKVDLKFSEDLTSEFVKDNYVNLAKVMINVDWIKETIKPASTQKGQESEGSSVADFLKKLFDMIHHNSGNKFKLSMSGPFAPKENLVVIDGTYCDVKPKDIYEFTAITQDSICRNITLSAEVPDTMQTAVFIGNKNNTAAKTPVAIQAGESTKSETEESEPQRLEDAKVAAVNAKKLDQTKFESMHSALVRENTSKSANAAEGAAFESTIYPLNLQLTIDGIEGIIFGNTVSCNYLPAQYSDKKNPKIAFTVTTVEHSISGGDWTTTINTVCRSIPTS